MEEKLRTLEQIVKETSNCDHRLSFDGAEWKLYLVASETTFRGTLEEVVDCATEEFLCYRKEEKQDNYQYAY
ncbi:hypothetical protein OGH69_16585 [Flavobacterium sp. MFBS3-15]|uniref:hypothetical protein n=1 Tax=Flavobacterium sp. MFBS3-15 TaxID=2989816 RepID=UPI002235BFAE|nr:hypothetical protein [Flavobacterium sp. MFBS3-15]MCW4470590.1 hypothetical protein [Flavobacterium sp. MFBS3-15]|tara:strand:+ start:92 stop:307 length:216 start_codon:yes stop_codon:yes gene_type:complete